MATDDNNQPSGSEETRSSSVASRPSVEEGHTQHTAHSTQNSVSSSHESPATSHHEADDEISLLDLLVVVAENLRLLVFGPLIVGLMALGIAFLIPPTFTARTTFLPPQQQQSAAAAMMAQLGGLAALAGTAAGLKNPTDQYVALLKSTTVADRLVDRFKLVELYDVEFRQDARKILDDKTNISSGKDGLIVVKVDDHSPQRAAEMANAYPAELQVLLGALALTEAQQRRVFFEKQLEQTKIRLTAAETALGKSGVTSAAIKANPEAAVEAVARLHAEVTAQEVRLAAMRNYLTETAPEFRQAQSELAALREQLKKREASEPVASAAGSYIEKYRDFKYQETLFELFVRQYELAKVDEAREGAVIQIVDVALPPERKSHPKKALIAILTSIATGMIFLVWVFVRQSVINSAVRADEAGKLAVIRTGLSRTFLFGRRH